MVVVRAGRCTPLHKRAGVSCCLECSWWTPAPWWDLSGAAAVGCLAVLYENGTSHTALRFFLSPWASRQVDTLT